MNKKKVYIYGYFAKNNLGDDLILLAEYALFSKYFDIEFVANKKSKNYLGKFNIKGLFQYLFTRQKNSLLIIGGGGLFPKDNYKTVIKYLLIKLFVKSYIFFGIGVDPILKNSKLFKSIFLKSKYSIFRDTQSKKNATINSDKSLVCTDIVACFWDDIQNNLNPRCINANRNYDYAIVLRGDKSDFVNQYYKELLNKLIYENKRIVIIPFSEPADREVASYLQQFHPSIEIAANQIEEKLCLIKNSDVIITQRYHGVILSLINNKKFIPIIYDHKFEYLLDEIGWDLSRFYFSQDLKIHLKQEKISSIDDILNFVKDINTINYTKYQNNFSTLVNKSKKDYLGFLYKKLLPFLFSFMLWISNLGSGQFRI